MLGTHTAIDTIWWKNENYEGYRNPSGLDGDWGYVGYGNAGYFAWVHCPPSGISCLSGEITTVNTIETPYGKDYWGTDAAASVQTYTLKDYTFGDGLAHRSTTVTEKLQEYVVSATPEARILAGRDMYIRADTVNNIASRVEAARDLNANINHLNDVAYQLNNIDHKTILSGTCSSPRPG
jgi:hypothetical protein